MSSVILGMLAGLAFLLLGVAALGVEGILLETSTDRALRQLQRKGPASSILGRGVSAALGLGATALVILAMRLAA